MPCSLPLDSVRVKSGARGICRDFFPIDTTAFRCLKSMKPCEVEAGGDTRCYSFWTILLSVMYKMKHQTIQASIDTSETKLSCWLTLREFFQQFRNKKCNTSWRKPSALETLETDFASYEISRSQWRVAGGGFSQNGRYGEPFNKEIFRSCFLVLLLVVVFFRHEKLSFFEGKSLKRDGCWLVR